MDINGIAGSKEEVRKLLATGHVDEALIRCKDLCLQVPGDTEAHLLLGMIYGNSGDLAAAEIHARKALEIEDLSEEAHLYLAAILRINDQCEEAMVHVNRALEINPYSAEGHNKLGALYQLQEELDKAEGEYRLSASCNPDHVLAHYNLGILQRLKADLRAAEYSFKRVLELSPDMAEAHNALGSTLFAQGKLQESIVACRKAISISPSYADAYVNLGLALDMQGRNHRAERCYRKAVELQPCSVAARQSLASSLQNRGEPGEAIVEYRRILDMEPGNTAALIALAHAYLYQGDTAECMACCIRLEECSSGDEEVLAGLASIHDRLGNFGQAFAYFSQILERGGMKVSTAQVYARICGHVSQCGHAIETIEDMLASMPLLPDDERQLRFAVAKLYDCKGDYTSAFHHYERANRQKFWSFSPQRHRELIDSLIDTYNSRFMREMPRASRRPEKLVFIVGMPRSGTSLVEQVLDRHSQVYGGGELTFLNLIVGGLREKIDADCKYPYFMPDISKITLNELAADYAGRLPQESRGYIRITDKLPENFLHLGLIELLFPDARIIHCKRDPLDTCLSCYFQDFAGYLKYAFNLEHLGMYYREYERLMRHWKEVLSIPVLDVQYEDFVAEPERTIRSVLEFCGMGWERECANFHTSNRVVRTASYDQVRRPIYKSSVGRWKNYRQFLGPLQDALGRQ